ncbi:hypothetical protein CSC82_05520 [Rhodobacteraceae bacterium 4F10]|nr:hypothetical protein CSC82_05520 [Rhodobacteraceae bacterium 4F10]
MEPHLKGAPQKHEPPATHAHHVNCDPTLLKHFLIFISLTQFVVAPLAAQEAKPFCRGWQIDVQDIEPLAAQERDNSNILELGPDVELSEALRAAGSRPVTILLAGGTYGQLDVPQSLRQTGDAPAPITLRSANPEMPAILTGLILDGVTNIRFEDIHFAYTPNDQSTFRDRPFQVRNSEDTSFSRVIFQGGAIDGLFAGQGLFVRNSKNVSITHSEFKEFHRGAVFLNVENLFVKRNNIHSMRSDGFDFAQVTNVEVAENYFHDFAPATAGDHRDMIQFWTNRTSAPSTNVYIHHNQLFGGENAGTQSIFMRNEVVDSQGGGNDMFYENIRIEHNLILNNDTHGISTAETNGLVVRHNTVLQEAHTSEEKLVQVPKIHLDPRSTDVTVQNNISGDAVLPDPRWIVSGNVIAKRSSPHANERYQALFLNALTPHPCLTDLQALPDGPIGKSGAGADITRFNPTPDQLAPVIHWSQKHDLVHLTARQSRGPMGQLPKDTQFLWALGDGTTSSEPDLSHRYAKPGEYDVRLSVTLPDGRTATNTSYITVRDPVLLDLVVEGSLLIDRSSYKTDLPDDQLPIPTPETSALGLSGEASIRFARGQPKAVLNTDAVWIAMDIRPASTTGGHLARVHGSWILSAEPNGEVLFIATNTLGQTFKLETKGARLKRGEWHTLLVSFDNEHTRMQVFVDGRLVGALPVSGDLNRSTSHGLILGKAFNWAGFDGDIRWLQIRSTPDKQERP